MSSLARIPRLVDHHAHSAEFSSDATIRMRDLVRAVEDQGVVAGVSDHWPSRSGGMGGLPALYRYLDAVDELADRLDTPILHGVELFLARPGNLLDTAVLERLDHVVGGIHDHPRRRGQSHAAWLDEILHLLDAEFARQPIDILAHATRELLRTGDAERDLPREWQDRLVGLLLRHGIALEINGKSGHPHEALLRRAAEAGVQLAVGSDIHTRRHLEYAFDYPRLMVERLGLSADQLFDARTPKPLRRSAGRWRAALGEPVLDPVLVA